MIFGKESEARSSALRGETVLNTLCYISTTEEPTGSKLDTNEHMIRVGNRNCLLQTVLELFGKTDKDEITLPNAERKSKLQSDFLEKISMVNLNEGDSFARMDTRVAKDPEELTGLVRPLWGDLQTQPGKQAASVNQISLRWVACTHTVHRVYEVRYKFLRFRAEETVYKTSDSAEIYIVPTANPMLKAFFISMPGADGELAKSLKESQTDLAFMVQRVLHEAESSAANQELWVPCFRVKSESRLPWVEGFHMKDSYI